MAVRAFPHQLAFLLNNPLRRLLLSPERLIGRIPIAPTDSILELGPGSGYFSVALAGAIPQGHLELVDVQPEMLAKTRIRLLSRGLTNVGYTLADAALPLPLAPGSFDVAVLVAVLGEVADRDRCLASIARALRPDGVLAIHEFWPDPDRIRPRDLEPLVEAHGFALTGIHGPEWNYTALFRRIQD